MTETAQMASWVAERCVIKQLTDNEKMSHISVGATERKSSVRTECRGAVRINVELMPVCGRRAEACSAVRVKAGVPLSMMSRLGLEE